ncbi:uncharacterized protein VICG_01026 [Vittaforma corneae ATCC 50505]|uniref:Cell differentiation protein rcd1 n=1 Tax=Vittaforma corneae (strain ATCC 50505) TaxID=993615 RepID=L2GN08_VITCO|nr:uncharacterized protein VICG_01026 [Vittaforma corneae ATCC 50505]ELA42009.1 hypothetical protein VICG_01026 [Vittaforma corneae ATCC 50505]
MEQNVEKLRKDLLLEENTLKTLEKVLSVVESSSKACELFWKADELVFVLFQNFIDSFYTLNTELFDEGEMHKIKLCIDILTNIAQKIKIEEFFLKLQLDYYIYPFLMSSGDESIKISTLKLFSALLKDERHEGMRISELLPLILKIVDSGSEECQILALETLGLVLIGNGLDYAVQTIDRFRAIDVVLNPLVKRSVLSKNLIFLKQLLKIYTRLCDHNNVRMKVREKPPEGLDSKEMMSLCERDEELLSIWTKFMHTLN